MTEQKLTVGMLEDAIRLIDKYPPREVSLEEFLASRGAIWEMLEGVRDEGDDR